MQEVDIPWVTHVYAVGAKRKFIRPSKMVLKKRRWSLTYLPLILQAIGKISGYNGKLVE